jgi:dihydroorotase (multifunctional complex type)
MSVLIKGGKVFYEGRFSESDVFIEYGKIKSVGKNIEKADETYDAKGMLVLPGLIDPHVHLREPGAEYKEDFRTGTQAAVAGGFTTVVDMPNNPFPTVTIAALAEKETLARKKAVCDVRFHFGATDHNFDEVKRAATAVSLKIYLGKTTGELYLRNPKSLERHLENYDGQFVFHASGDGKTEQEQLDATFRNIELIGSLSIKHRRRSHIAHASTGKEVALSKSFHLTVETAPHYLFLDSNDAKKLGYKGTVYPNLRTGGPESLWNKINEIDCIATDHAPHTIEDKKNGAHGFPGLETSLGMMLTAYHSGKIGLEWIVEHMSGRPAEILRLEKIGKIKEGFHGDVTILDPKKEWTVKGDRLYTKCGWSPFEGKKLKGKVKSVFCRGDLIFDDFSFTK